MDDEEYKFEISLHVLDHLGRGLYRNFATVVAEAISNSWDAEATEVHITIDKDKNRMVIEDNGKGMDSGDFQHKFLNVAYARRKDKYNKSKRKVLGRKGIGKLALISIAKKVIINTKKEGSKETGGIINNRKLDDAIKGEKTVEEYNLEPIKKDIFKENERGTRITFEGIEETINNPDIIKKYLAIIFNFTLSSPDEKFKMFINDEEINKECLSELYKKTQFLWTIGKIDDRILEHLVELDLKKERSLGEKSFVVKGKKYLIEGYIASVSKPSELAIPGSGDKKNGDNGFRAQLNLFVNGRLRHEDILKDLPSSQTSQYPSSYVYGEIHINSFDNTKKKDEDDIFTSNRESVIKDDERYKKFVEEMDKISREVFDEWGRWRKISNPFVSTPDDFEYLTDEKVKLIKEFQNIDQRKDPSKQVDRILKKMRPQRSKKRILICHARKDKTLANKVEAELLSREIKSSEILYTSSSHKESRIPAKEDVFEYIRNFFIQDWYKKPIVIFVLSDDMEKRWSPCLEAGAAWVISEKGVEQVLTMKSSYKEKPPLNIGKRYIRFDAKENFEDPDGAEDIFDYVKSIV